MLRIKALESSWESQWSAWLVTPGGCNDPPRLEVTQFYRGLKRIHVIEALELSEEQNRWDQWDGGSRNGQDFPKMIPT